MQPNILSKHDRKRKNCMSCGEEWATEKSERSELNQQEMNGQNETLLLFHATRRENHNFCLECLISYLTTQIETLSKTKKYSERVKCFCFEHKSKNPCKHVLTWKQVKTCLGLAMEKVNGVPNEVRSDQREERSKRSEIVKPDQKNAEKKKLEDIILKIERFSLLDTNKDFTECKGCDTLLDLTLSNEKVVCLECKVDWCKNCGAFPYHTTYTCNEFRMEHDKSENGLYLKKCVKDGVMKLCPGCQFITEKNHGCNKITCESCKAYWCWLCNQKVESYEHFNLKNAGKCTGRLWEGVDQTK